MNAVEKSISFLSSILTSLGFTVQGRAVVMEDEDGPIDVTVGDKVLVLPTVETLKASNWDKEIAFWPLCENTLRGESEIQQELLVMVRGAVNVRLAALLWNLVKVAGSEECKANKLSPEQAVFLPSLPGLDAEMSKKIAKLVQGVDPAEYKSSLIHMNLKRRTKINGVQYDRACMVRFPLAEMERSDKPYGSPLRVKDMDAVTGLLDYILPDWQVENAYSRGTDSKVAPYFVATMLAYQNINARISEVAKIFVDLFPIFGTLIHDDDWVTDMDDLARMRDSMPSLGGNEGLVARSNNTDAPIINDPKPAPGMNMPVNRPDLPWNGPVADAPAAQPARAPVIPVDDDAVEYVPRNHQPQPGHIPMMQPTYNVQAPQAPAGYGQQPNQGLTFAQIQAQRQQQQYGQSYNVNAPPAVGGSPFSNTAPANTVTHQNNGYDTTYINPQQQYNIPPQNPGRGY